MKNNIEIIKYILLLLDTIEEGIKHAKNQFSELRYEEALNLLKDCMQGIISIESSIKLVEFLEDEKILTLSLNLKNDIYEIFENYRIEKMQLLEKKVETKLLPDFYLWSNDLQIKLRPYTLS